VTRQAEFLAKPSEARPLTKFQVGPARSLSAAVNSEADNPPLCDIQSAPAADRNSCSIPKAIILLCLLFADTKRLPGTAAASECLRHLFDKNGRARRDFAVTHAPLWRAGPA